MSKISVVPISENKQSEEILKQALANESDLVSIKIFDDSVRIKNIASDVVINQNGTKKHVCCSVTADVMPGQRFSVNNFNFQVK